MGVCSLQSNPHQQYSLVSGRSISIDLLLLLIVAQLAPSVTMKQFVFGILDISLKGRWPPAHWVVEFGD